MAKRFLDTGFLNQKWIRKLSPERKSFVIYLMLKCDNAGIIDLDMEDAEFWIGKKIGDFMSFLPEDYLIPINESGKYFQPKFIEWQYGDLTSNKNIVAQARQILDKHGLIDSDFNLILDKSYLKVTKELPKKQVTGKGNSIDKGKDKSKEEKYKFGEFVFLTEIEHKKLLANHGQYWTKKIIDKLDNYKGSSGKKYKSDYRAILSWVVEDMKKSPDYSKYMIGKLRDEQRAKERDQSAALKEVKNRNPEVDEINKYEEEENIL